MFARAHWGHRAGLGPGHKQARGRCRRSAPRPVFRTSWKFSTSQRQAHCRARSRAWAQVSAASSHNSRPNRSRTGPADCARSPAQLGHVRWQQGGRKLHQAVRRSLQSIRGRPPHPTADRRPCRREPSRSPNEECRPWVGRPSRQLIDTRADHGAHPQAVRRQGGEVAPTGGHHRNAAKYPFHKLHPRSSRATTHRPALPQLRFRQEQGRYWGHFA